MFYYGEDNEMRLRCDCCGEAIMKGFGLETRAQEAGWLFRRINGRWKEFCPECKKQILAMAAQRFAEHIEDEILNEIKENRPACGRDGL